jgi:hypothetical protein
VQRNTLFVAPSWENALEEVPSLDHHLRIHSSRALAHSGQVTFPQVTFPVIALGWTMALQLALTLIAVRAARVFLSIWVG